MRLYLAGDPALQRRKVLAGLGAAALLVLSGCGNLPLRRQSDLELAFSDLDELLARAQGHEAEQLTAIARSIRDSSRLLIQTQQDFIEAFNRAASTRSVSAAELESQMLEYDRQRRAQRNELLQLQDDLYQQMPPELWSQAQDILNRKGQAIGSSNVSEG